LEANTLDQLNGTDILFVPVSRQGGWSLETAVKTIKSIEPKIVIPMHYAMEGLKVEGLESEKKLLEALGGAVEKTPKLTIKKKDLPEGTTKIVVIEKG
jgi:L-ascorbate metabolism protein UlaG (beta-lactamase superfamily)